MKKIMIILVLFFFFLGCTVPSVTEESSVELTRKVVTPTNNSSRIPKEKDDEKEIPSGSYALFHNEGLSSLHDRLLVDVQYNDFEGGGYIADIQWDKSSSAVVRYLPRDNGVDIMKTYTSASYSRSVMYPYTAAGRFFTVRDWGSDWSGDNDRWTLSEINPLTGDSVGADTQFNAGSFAVVKDKIYFTKGGNKDSLGRVTSNPKLMTMDLGEYKEQQIREFEYGTSGTLYSGNDYLFSVLGDYSADQITLEIRTIDLDNGNLEILYSNIITDRSGLANIFPGNNAIYHLSKQGNIIQIHRYPVVGNSEALLEVELEGDEKNVYLAEDNNKLAILTSSLISGKGYRMTSLFVYDLDTKELEDIKIEPFNVLASYSRIGFPFLVLE